MKKLTLMAVMLLFSALSFAQVNIANGLLAYYPYSGNANDASGNGYNGTVGGATITTDRFGVSNNAYSFSGNTITANVPYNLDNDFSHNFWFKLSNASMVSGFFSWGDKQGTDYNSYSNFGANAGTLYTSLSEEDNISTCDLLADVSSNASGNFDNNWHMATTVKTGTTLSFYIDTILIGTTNVSDSCNVNLDINSFKVGNSLVGLQFSGSVDDIMLFSRELNSPEIAYLYNLNSSWTPTTSTILVELNEVTIYPNPISESAFINFNETDLYLVNVLDIAGRKIFQTQVNSNNLEITTANWTAGIYNVIINSSKGEITSKRIVKE